MSTTIQIRTDKQLKREVQGILDGLGIDLSTAINVYLSHIRNTRGIPFKMIVEKKVQEVKKARELKAKPKVHVKPAVKGKVSVRKHAKPARRGFWKSILG